MVQPQQWNLSGTAPQVLVKQIGQDGLTPVSATNPAVGGGTTYQLAGTSGTPGTGISLATTVASTPVTGINGASYIWNVQFPTTANVSLFLQALSADGSTYANVNTTALTASGSLGVVIGNNATVRIINTGSATVTGLYSSLS